MVACYLPGCDIDRERNFSSSRSLTAQFQWFQGSFILSCPFHFYCLSFKGSLLSLHSCKNLLIHLPFLCLHCVALLSFPKAQHSDTFPSLAPSCLLGRHNSTQYSRYFTMWPTFSTLFLKIIWTSIMPLIIPYHNYVQVC